MWLDLDGLRVVHACWDERAMSTSRALNEQAAITTTFLQLACTKGYALFDPVEVGSQGQRSDIAERHLLSG